MNGSICIEGCGSMKKKQCMETRSEAEEKKKTHKKVKKTRQRQAKSKVQKTGGHWEMTESMRETERSFLLQSM